MCFICTSLYLEVFIIIHKVEVYSSRYHINIVANFCIGNSVIYSMRLTRSRTSDCRAQYLCSLSISIIHPLCRKHQPGGIVFLFLMPMLWSPVKPGRSGFAEFRALGECLWTAMDDIVHHRSDSGSFFCPAHTGCCEEYMLIVNRCVKAVHFNVTALYLFICTCHP